jgi:predicted HD phosphohydrolase
MDRHAESAHGLDDVVALLAEAVNHEEPNEEIVGLTILDHGLQCAALLRRDHPADAELQVAGLLHDVGHLLTTHPEQHGIVAADYLSPILGPRVASLVEGHVPAKRYLVATDAEYRTGLSVGSRRTLETQGGAMRSEESSVFRDRDDFDAVVALRRADESAKDPDAAVSSLRSWLPVLRSLAETDRHPRPPTSRSGTLSGPSSPERA